ncbi:hypothetical protein [Salimicrobium halophilum]|uniref:Uncharacterized protein n=1 Tax=Salimicrobium halophilum TaxID=86666 RepID=A0A1G8WE36_9BACI|nr:hypothetical protein [Salimicrobium halophilum]SDJ76463.1 hypothetical protein SAMN04490247_3143 [Salimicrobium halophilum]
MNEEPIEVKDEELTAYIQERLIEEGIVVKGEDILKVVDYYYEFLNTLGLIEDYE